ncbi:MAG: hypothetical protein IJ033_06255 [Clostridia bacterium]|nr:hypothetical protein [Clostridia bacterium]
MSYAILFKHNAIEMVTPTGNRFLLDLIGEDGSSINMEIAQKESSERYATYVCKEVLLSAVRYSKRSFAFCLTLKGNVKVGARLSLETDEIAPPSLERATYSVLGAPQRLKIEPKRHEDSALYLSLYEGALDGLSEGDSHATVWLGRSALGAKLYGFISLGDATERDRVTLAEIKKAVSYYTLKSVSDKVVTSGIRLDMSAVYSKIRAQVSFKDGEYLLTDDPDKSNEDLLIDALRHILIGDVQGVNVCSLVDGSTLSALVSWMAFIRQRNHILLGECYQKLISKANQKSNDDPIYRDVLERMSIVLGCGESATDLGLINGVGETKGALSEVDVLTNYLLYRAVGDDQKLYALSKKCVELYNANPNATIYPLILLATYVDVEYFMDDLCPSIAFGTTQGKDVKISNLTIFGQKIDVSLSDEYSYLAVGGVKAMEIVGARAVVRNLKNEVSGCSFFIKTKGSATVSINAPIFSTPYAKKDRYHIRIPKGVSKFVIKNHRVTVEKL